MGLLTLHDDEQISTTSVPPNSEEMSRFFQKIGSCPVIMYFKIEDLRCYVKQNDGSS